MASTSGLQWTFDAYTLVLASVLMLAGSTADRIGRKRVFVAGLVVFTLGSVLCSLAPNLRALVAFRMVQAVGGSMLNPIAMSIITNTFTDPRERARAIGAWGAVVGISMAAGPLVGGLLVESVGRRSIFWINLPVGLAALLLTLRFVPESRAGRTRRPDPVGQLLVIALFGSLTYAITEAPNTPLASVAPLAVVALAALAGLLVGSRGPRLPLLIAGFAMTASGILFAAFKAETSNTTLFAGYVLFGIGFGFVNAPITNTAVSGMPRAQAGVAAAVASTGRQLGQTLGVAVVGAVLASGVGASSYRDTFVSAARPGWWIIAVCGFAVLALGAVTSGRWGR
ncbi:MFS transporter [Streptomyces coeruleorubidus]|uniref:MFS transporter n=1 Tax=Streptomyces coeruleorubidus TaxID=116188 RepID=UPI003CD00529